MILDTLENFHLYCTLNPRFQAAFEFLLNPNTKALTSGKHSVLTDEIYAIVEHTGRDRQGALLEAHRKYIDIQLIWSGEDRMGWRPLHTCQKPTMEYDAKSDYQLFADEPESWSNVTAGRFAIFFPTDAHMPSISAHPIHKIVVKVAV